MITLEIRTKCPITSTTPEETPEDLLGLLAALCDMLAESQCVEFHVSGFGQDPWPTDVRTDLLTILEQLPDVSLAIRANDPEFDLDFYEQGIGRLLSFARSGNTVSVTCVSTTDWAPNPSTLTLTVAEVSLTLERLRLDFIQLAKRICPALADTDLVRQWSVTASLPI